MIRHLNVICMLRAIGQCTLTKQVKRQVPFKAVLVCQE